MKIVTLVENHSESQLSFEHGLSFYIEYKGASYLLDAGQSDVYIKNAKDMGIHLSDVSAAILSHAHYDHAGGFAWFADENSRAGIYMQKSARYRYFSEKEDGIKDIGIPSPVYEKLTSRIRYIEGDKEIAPGVWLIAHHKSGLDERGRKMRVYKETEGERSFDDFAHEQSLVFELPEGLVVLNSCSHGGVDLILEEVEEVFPEKSILAMFGGFHLMGSEGPDSMRESEEQVRALGDRLSNMQVQKLYTGHCTGTKAFPILKEILGDKLQLLVTGSNITIG